MSKKALPRQDILSRNEKPFDAVASDAPLFRLSSPLAQKISSLHAERINERELLSLYALLAYVAENQDIRQETVQMIVEAEFGVDHISKIHREDYDNAVRFLVEVKIGDKVN